SRTCASAADGVPADAGHAGWRARDPDSALRSNLAWADGGLEIAQDQRRLLLDNWYVTACVSISCVARYCSRRGDSDPRCDAYLALDRGLEIAPDQRRLLLGQCTSADPDSALLRTWRWPAGLEIAADQRRLLLDNGYQRGDSPTPRSAVPGAGRAGGSRSPQTNAAFLLDNVRHSWCSIKLVSRVTAAARDSTPRLQYLGVGERGSRFARPTPLLLDNGTCREYAAARDSDSALLQYLALAERGLEIAQTNAAFLLDNGEVRLFSESERWARALQLWSRAASQGSGAARVKLGDYHYYGLGTQQDLEAAAYHYRIASEQLHNAQATFNLGYMHERGLGLAQDAHLAKRCYDLAAESSPDARLPAALALARLNAATALSQILDSPLAVIFLTDSALLSNWDLYLITALLGALGVVVYLRRPTQQPAN
ncbi:hypothetical protein SFRURICE_000438, partial [Spodoptera frugiperda]